MKKYIVMVLVCSILISCLGLCACKWDKVNGLEEDSEVTSIKVIYQDGFEYDMTPQEIDFIVSEIKSLGEFTQDSKLIVNNKWSYDYEYTFKLNVKRRQFLKKVDTTMTYHFGTLGTYTDGSGKETQTNYELEWTLMSTASTRKIVNTSEEKASAIRQTLDSIAKNIRDKQYENIKSRFVNLGFMVTELQGNELQSVWHSQKDTYIDANASSGFEANNPDTGEQYFVYFSNTETAKEFAMSFNGYNSKYYDVFCGYGYLNANINNLADVLQPAQNS